MNCQTEATLLRTIVYIEGNLKNRVVNSGRSTFLAGIISLSFTVFAPTTQGIASAKGGRAGGVTAEHFCLDQQRQANGPEAQYRTCVDERNRMSARVVPGLLCASETCEIRLRRTAPGRYGGGAFTLRLSFDAKDSVVRTVLVGARGRHARLEQDCGASGCPSKPARVSGDFQDVTYTPIGNPENPDYVILTVRRAALR